MAYPAASGPRGAYAASGTARAEVMEQATMLVVKSLTPPASRR